MVFHLIQLRFKECSNQANRMFDVPFLTQLRVNEFKQCISFNPVILNVLTVKFNIVFNGSEWYSRTG